MLPRVGQAEDTAVIGHPITFRYALGPSRMLWAENRGGDSVIELYGCAHTTKDNEHPGYMRLGRVGPPDPSHKVSISLAGETGIIQDLSWDEGSGRICAVVSPSDNDDLQETRSLLMIDLV